ncbi:MAG: phosphatidate cytidylyltransferase, partial [Clostridia bacterium]
FDHNRDLKDLFCTIFVLIYPLALFATFIVINNSDWGLLGIMLALLVPIMTDTMAYFVGVSIGGKKLCPDISPKKTISGAVGGILGGILGGMIVFMLFDVFNVFASFKNVGTTNISNSLVVSGVIYGVFGLVGGILSELGDLGASWMKRKANIKDFGKIFPGHGGMMDRLDSILFVMPLVFIMIEILKAVIK